MFALTRRLLRDRRGATSIEYALICACIFLAIVGSVQIFAGRATEIFDTVAEAVAEAVD